MRQSPPARHYSGTIQYRGPDGETGREWFQMIGHGDAGRTLRALCRMDDIDLWRDVSMSLDAASRPRDAFVRVTQAGIVQGSMLYTIQSDALELDGATAEHGRVSRRIALTEPLPYLGLHPLVGDALVALCRGTDAPGEFRTVHGYTNSSSPNGETGLLAVPTAIAAAYLGTEQVTTPAGIFAARHYQLRWQPQWPAADLMVSGDEALFLRLTWALNRSCYELVELHALG